jgi:transposase
MYAAVGTPATRPQRHAPPPQPSDPVFLDRGLSTRTQNNIQRFLSYSWHLEAIASQEHCSKTAVNNVKRNLEKYQNTRCPLQGKIGRPPAISDEDAEALFDELVYSGWMYQDEMVRWLAIERDCHVSRSAIQRLLKQRKWSERTLRPFSVNRNEDLRQGYQVRMARYTQEDLCFIDEAIFNKKSGWRHKAYAPVGTPCRYSQDIRRGDTWAILPAYTAQHGYLPCTGVKDGYFNREEFLEWIETQLLPTLRAFYGNKPMVIVLDNVSIHTNDDVRAIVERAGHILQYLPPYSPDYNPIELTFAVLKAWIRRNYCFMRHRFGRNCFGDFLRAAIRESRCDRFARKHFKYAAGGLYLDNETLIRARRELRTETAFDFDVEEDSSAD